MLVITNSMSLKKGFGRSTEATVIFLLFSEFVKS